MLLYLQQIESGIYNPDSRTQLIRILPVLLYYTDVYILHWQRDVDIYYGCLSNTHLINNVPVHPDV